jgi:hypothetical protein
MEPGFAAPQQIRPRVACLLIQIKAPPRHLVSFRAQRGEFTKVSNKAEILSTPVGELGG